MCASERVNEQLSASLTVGERGRPAADRLCRSCVELLGVDGAAISLVYEGDLQGTFGTSAARSRALSELQFTYGEGPCLDAVRLAGPVLVADLADTREDRWPAYTPTALQLGARSVFALPVTSATFQLGALNLYRDRPGELTGWAFDAALLAAELAVLPLLDLMTRVQAGNAGEDGWGELAEIARVEVAQATGMIMAQLGVPATEALIRLRAHAFTAGLPLTDAAWQVLERRLRLPNDAAWQLPDPTEGRPA